MATIPAFYFYAGVANAIVALSIIPIRRTTIGQNPSVAEALGSAPSYFGLLSLVMLLLSFIKPKSPSTFWITVIIVTAGTVAHEILQNWTVRVFDYLDLMAILFSFATFRTIHVILSKFKARSNQSLTLP